ncbi:MAG: hypothetical protein M3067_06890 [Chloroflexota bacterium]|nr:hypothetical protein [Chloroflexota bacterium]
MDLPKHPVVHGHPIHAILSDGPIVLIPLAFAADLWDRITSARGLRLGDVLTAGAAATGLAAAVVGWIDWLTIPGEHPARRPATIHGLINTAAVLTVVVAVPARRRRLRLLTAATTAILTGAWIGGDLVFRHGWRVKPAEEAEIVEARLSDPAGVAAFAEARSEVADFERRKTFLPAG